jgi:hypothetical protein
MFSFFKSLDGGGGSGGSGGATAGGAGGDSFTDCFLYLITCFLSLSFIVMNNIPMWVSDDGVREMFADLASRWNVHLVDALALSSVDKKKDKEGDSYRRLEKIAKKIIKSKETSNEEAFKVLVPFVKDGHFFFLGLVLNKVQTCYVYMATMRKYQQPPSVVTRFLGALAQLTNVACHEYSPHSPNGYLHQEVTNGCAGYVVAFAEYFLESFSDIPLERPTLSEEKLTHFDDRASTIVATLRAQDAVMKRGEFRANSFGSRHVRFSLVSYVLFLFAGFVWPYILAGNGNHVVFRWSTRRLHVQL